MNTLDISRLLQQPEKRYVGVRMQQGRLLLDGDFNDQAYLVDQDLRRSLTDLLGQRGSLDEGFSLGRAMPWLPANWPTQTVRLQAGDYLCEEEVLINGQPVPVRPVTLRAGSFHLGGMRLVLEQAEHVALQRDYLQLRAEDLPARPEPTDEEPEPTVSLRAFYYLHAWEQTISAAEDEELFEVALGEDTGGRVRLMRRVGVFPNVGAGDDCGAAWQRFTRSLVDENTEFDRGTGELRSRGRLRLAFASADVSSDCAACLPQPALKFLGANNQTLRLMLTAPDRFVWALDNASTLYRVEVSGLDTPGADVVVTMVTPPGSESDWPLEHQVVEILPFGAVLDGPMPVSKETPYFKKAAARMGAFSRVVRAFDPGTRSFVISAEGNDEMRSFVTRWDPRHPASRELNFDAAGDTRYFYMRVWHVAEPGGPLDLPASNDPSAAPLLGTDIVPLLVRRGRRGDYWVISSRPETDHPVVPVGLSENPAGEPPHGPRDFYAPLGLIQPFERPEAESPQPRDEHKVGDVFDCRTPITLLSDQGCVTFTVGDGLRSHGDFQSVQEAIDALPEAGGTIQLREGTYRERIRISGLNDVVIEACGGVVLETPPTNLDPYLQSSPLPAEPASLVEIEGGERITLRGFTLHSVGDRAVRVRDGAQHVLLENLSVRSGVRSGSDFLPGVQSLPGVPAIDLPLLQLQASYACHLRALTVEGQGRCAVQLSGSSYARLEELTLVGAAAGIFAPTRALVEVTTSDHLTVRGGVLSTYGQVGLRLSGLQTQDVDVEGVTVIAGSFRSLQGRATSTRSGLEVDGARRVRVTGSAVTMDESTSEHAAIVLLGRDLFVERTRVEVMPRCFESPSPSPSECSDLRFSAWGGIHLRGGCDAVYLRENRIVGGVGHGVTLGSVRYAAAGELGVHLGAGYGQVAGRSDGVLAATGLLPAQLRDAARRALFGHDEGSLRNVQITDNRIEQMNGNGISVVSVLGMANRDDLVDVEGLRIEGNTIVDNLKAPFDRMQLRQELLPLSDSLTAAPIALQLLPAGGIVLGTVRDADIHGNVVLRNGTAGLIPTSGIFVLNGDGIRITHNRIASNGGRSFVDSPRSPARVQGGVRAGIAVLLAGTGALETISDLRDSLDDLGAGLSRDGSSVRVANNSVRQPEGRALQLICTGPTFVENNFFSSEGNHGPDTRDEAYKVGDVVFVLNLGHPWETPLGNVASGDYGQYARPGSGSRPLTDRYMDVDSPSSPRNFVGEGGRLLFSNNQVTLDWEVLRVPRAVVAPIAFYPVALLTLDHLSVDHNQFSFRLRGTQIPTSPPRTRSPVFGYDEPILAQVLGIGATSNITGNRFSEPVGHSILSLCCLSHLMAGVTYNQSAHELLLVNQAEGDAAITLPQPEVDDAPGGAPSPYTPYTVKAHNQVLFTAKRFSTDGLGVTRLVNTARSFLRLVWRQE
jgi:hypothetical protein